MSRKERVQFLLNKYLAVLIILLSSIIGDIVWLANNITGFVSKPYLVGAGIITLLILLYMLIILKLKMNELENELEDL